MLIVIPVVFGDEISVAIFSANFSMNSCAFDLDGLVIKSILKQKIPYYLEISKNLEHFFHSKKIRKLVKNRKMYKSWKHWQILKI